MKNWLFGLAFLITTILLPGSYDFPVQTNMISPSDLSPSTQPFFLPPTTQPFNPELTTKLQIGQLYNEVLKLQVDILELKIKIEILEARMILNELRRPDEPSDVAPEPRKALKIFY